VSVAYIDIYKLNVNLASSNINYIKRAIRDGSSGKFEALIAQIEIAFFTMSYWLTLAYLLYSSATITIKVTL